MAWSESAPVPWFLVVYFLTKNLFHNDLSLRQQTIAQARCMKARC